MILHETIFKGSFAQLLLLLVLLVFVNRILKYPQKSGKSQRILQNVYVYDGGSGNFQFFFSLYDSPVLPVSPILAFWVVQHRKL